MSDSTRIPPPPIRTPALGNRSKLMHHDWVRWFNMLPSYGLGSNGIQGVTGVAGEDGMANFQDLPTFPPVPTDEPGLLWNTIDSAMYVGIPGYQSWIQVSSGAMTGATGYQGSTGPGVPGETGTQGPDGLRGYRGYTGVKGCTGLMGLQGDCGIQGRTGLPGAQGVTGVVGPTGVQGVTGPRGVTGVQGATGTTGSFPVITDKYIPFQSGGSWVDSSASMEPGLLGSKVFKIETGYPADSTARDAMLVLSTEASYPIGLKTQLRENGDNSATLQTYMLGAGHFGILGLQPDGGSVTIGPAFAPRDPMLAVNGDLRVRGNADIDGTANIDGDANIAGDLRADGTVSAIELLGSPLGTYGGLVNYANQSHDATGWSQVQFSDFAQESNSADIVADLANDKITITRTGMYRVHCHVCLHSDRTDVDQLFQMKVSEGLLYQWDQLFARNYVIREQYCTFSVGGFVDIVTAPADLTVWVCQTSITWTKCTTNAASFTVERMYFLPS